MMSHLNLFVDDFEGSAKECRDAIVRQISTSCTTLQTFRLELDLIPQDWVSSNEDIKHQQQACVNLNKTFESLRVLVSRVREFELACLSGQNEGQCESLWERVVPGQRYVRTEENYRIKWTSNIAGARRSFTFH